MSPKSQKLLELLRVAQARLDECYDPQAGVLREEVSDDQLENRVSLAAINVASAIRLCSRGVAPVPKQKRIKLKHGAGGPPGETRYMVQEIHNSMSFGVGELLPPPAARRLVEDPSWEVRIV